MWRELVFHNKKIERGVRQSLTNGLVRINPDTQLIDISPNAYSMAFDSNWLFFGHNTALRDCFTWHSVLFNCFDGFVHEFCKLRCYKVVIKTRNFLDAMNFRNAVLAIPHTTGGLTPLQGKVGKDERDYTDGYFNGFVYCDGLEDARKKYAVVRKLVDEHVADGENIPIIIKRACTEFEQRHGPTDNEFWQSATQDELDFQHLLEDIYDDLKHSSVQADWIQNKVISDMMRWANTVGDKSWMQHFGCEDFLTMKAVTYHEVKEVVKKRPTKQKVSRKRASKK